MWFPINLHYLYGIPINSHPGAFGVARKFNFHEGIDLYGHKGQQVYAIEPGEVISVAPFTGPSAQHDWWLDTEAVLVKNDSGTYWVYGEVDSQVKVGDRVKQGTVVGEITPVLPPHKHRPDIPGHSVNMLHLEKWSSAYNPDEGWAAWKTREARPPWLADPTPDLIAILQKVRHPFKFLTY